MAARNQSGGSCGVEMQLTDYNRPWNNPDLLDRYYNDRDYSTAEIADEVFNGEVSRETIRKRLHEFDLMPEDGGRPSSSDPHATRKKLLAMGQENVGEDVPEGDESYKRYTLSGRGETDAE
jgi:hypothetical protein